ncbi:MAG TPA: phosphoribosyltransferase family protein [Syntrophales bacterium]|nr:phosphoribosyltransferase family protein [Syntrophales bacterium]
MKKGIRVLKPEKEILKRIKETAKEIKKVMSTNEFAVVGILDDAFVFLADLVRALDTPLRCHFMRITCEEHANETEILFTSEFNPRGLDILIVAAIADTGITLDYAARHLSEKGAKSVRTCVLLDKPGSRCIDIKPDFTVFETSEQFVFGYGLGFQNQFRQLPYLAVLEA